MIGIKIPWQVFACAGVVVLLSLVGYKLYDLGRDHTQAKWDASIERGKAIVADLKSKQGSITIGSEVRIVEVTKTIREKGRVIRQEIPVYIPQDTANLPGGFRLLHDAAATNSIPSTSEIPNAFSVSVREATDTITKNYTTCNLAISELKELRAWVSEQGRAYLEECSKSGVHCSKDSLSEWQSVLAP